MSVVLDASAILAVIFKEAGADAVLARTDGALLSTVNLFEALAKARRNRDIDPVLLVEELRKLHIHFLSTSAKRRP